MKRIINLFLIVLLAFLLAPATAYATETTTLDDSTVLVSGDYEYTLNENNEATITKYKGNENNVVIPEKIDGCKVVAIGDYSFSENNIIERVNIPDTVTVLKDSAFQSCTNLKKVVMPNGIKEIGKYAFAHCEKLEDVQLSGGIRSLYEGTFEGCTSLEKIILPYNLHYIDTNTFAECTNLKEVTIPYETLFILDGAFYNPSQLTVYGIPITYAEEWANSVGATFVTYEKSATSVSMLLSEFTLKRNSLENLLILEVEPRDFTDRVKWSSSDEDVVTVTDDGCLVWQGGGTAIVTAQLGDLIASCKVTSIQEGTVVYVEFEGTYDKVLNIELVDANGNVVKQTGAVGSNDRLPLADLPKGTYTMKVSKENYVPRTYTLVVGEENIQQKIELHKFGDITGDNTINARDKKMLYNHIAGSAELVNYDFAVGDVTGDNILNARDKKMIYNHIAGTSSLWE